MKKLIALLLLIPLFAFGQSTTTSRFNRFITDAGGGVYATTTGQSFWYSTASSGGIFRGSGTGSDLSLRNSAGTSIIDIGGGGSSTIKILGNAMTFPATNATIARTDAAQTFSGVQTFSGLLTANAGISVPTGLNLTGAGTATVTGFASVSATAGTLTNLTVGSVVTLGGGVASAWGAGYQAIELPASAIMYPTTGTDLNLLSNAYYDGAWKYKTTAVASRYVLSAGGHTFNIAPSGTADAALTWVVAASIDTNGNFFIGANAASNRALNINSNAGFQRQINFNSAGVSRWLYVVDSVAESGSDAGSNFNIHARTDAGGSIDIPFSITRAAGGSIVLTRPVSTSSATDATSATAASLKTAGGIAAVKALWIGTTSRLVGIVTHDANPVFSATSSPASNAACTAGTLTWDASYVYVCTATAAWKRSALTGSY